MGDTRKTREELKTEVMQDLSEAVERWLDSFERDSSGGSALPTIDEVEDGLLRLDGQTREIFLRMASDRLSAIDERELVAAKKGSSPGGASTS